MCTKEKLKYKEYFESIFKIYQSHSNTSKSKSLFLFQPVLNP